MNIEPFCNDPNNQPDFCNAPFYYIDPSKCKFSENNTYSQSIFSPNLYYSFSTCGTYDIWRQFLIMEQLKGETLHVGVPALYYPDHFRLDADGNLIFWDLDINAGVGELQGIYIDVLNRIGVFAGFTVQYESVSANSLEEHDSPWDACIQDVAQGLLDMCVGNFWETTKRREKVLFSAAVFNDIFYMRVPLLKEDKSFKAKVKKIFRPFTFSLWLTILFATFGVGVCYTILDANRKTYKSDIPGENIESIYTATMELMHGANQNKDQLICHHNLVIFRIDYSCSLYSKSGCISSTKEHTA